MFDLHITGIIYFFFIGGKAEREGKILRVGRYITAVFSVGFAVVPILLLGVPSEDETTKKRKKMTSPFLSK